MDRTSPLDYWIRFLRVGDTGGTLRGWVNPDDYAGIVCSVPDDAEYRPYRDYTDPDDAERSSYYVHRWEWESPDGLRILSAFR